MNRTQLSYFYEVTEKRTISSAAQSLHLTKQALSQSIKDLERELDCTLFERERGGVVPTEAGLLLRAYVEKEALLYDELVSTIAYLGDRRRLRVGTHLSHRTAEEIAALLDYREKGCNVSIELVDVEEHLESWELLNARDLDVVVSRTHPHGEGLAWTRHRTTEVVAILGVDDPLATKETVDFASDLEGYHYLSTSRDTLRELELYLVRGGIEGVYVSPHPDVLKHLLTFPGNVFITPLTAAHLFASEPHVIRSVVSFPLDVGIYFVYRNPPEDGLSEYLYHLETRFPRGGDDGRAYVTRNTPV